MHFCLVLINGVPHKGVSSGSQNLQVTSENSKDCVSCVFLIFTKGEDCLLGNTVFKTKPDVTNTLSCFYLLVITKN